MPPDASSRKNAAARRREIGRAGEAAAAAFLTGRGLAVVARNYHTPFGELDIVAHDGDCVVFAEVKTGSSGASVKPEEQFTPRKARRIFNAAVLYLQREFADAEPDFRFDFVAVTRRGEAYDVEHFPGIPLDQYFPPEVEKP